MTAIDLTRLQKQIGELVSLFSEPTAFIKTLHEILDFYERRAYRPSRVLVPKTFMRSYNLPAQVLPLIEIGLKESASLRPAEALALAQTLWQDPYYEARELAALVLGQLPAEVSADVLSTLRPGSPPRWTGQPCTFYWRKPAWRPAWPALGLPSSKNCSAAYHPVAIRRAACAGN